MREISLVRELLDHQLLDCDDARCGKVDDVAIEGSPPRVTALVTGPDEYRRRSALVAWFARRLRARGSTEIAWADVEEAAGAAVNLRRTAADLGISQAETRARRWLERVPHA